MVTETHTHTHKLNLQISPISGMEVKMAEMRSDGKTLDECKRVAKPLKIKLDCGLMGEIRWPFQVQS